MNAHIMKTSTSTEPQTSQGSEAMQGSTHTNDGRNSDATSSKKKIPNFYLSENGRWKVRNEMLSHSDLEKYTKKIIWDESVTLKEDQTFARYLLESLDADLGHRDTFVRRTEGEGDKQTKKVELQKIFPHEAERWETLRDRMLSIPYFDRYVQRNPDWSLDELFSSCLMDLLEEQLNSSATDDGQNDNHTTLEQDTSRGSGTLEKDQEKEEEFDGSDDFNKDCDDDDDEDGEDGDEDDDEDVDDELVDDDEGDVEDDDGDVDDDDDEDWVYDDEAGDSEDDDEDIDTDVVSICDDPNDSDYEPEVHKPQCRRNTRQASRSVIQHKRVSSSDGDSMEEATEVKQDTAMESKQTMYECKFCREVFRTPFLVMQHYTTKHPRHVYRSRRQWEECATLLRHCEDCNSYVASLKQHRLEKHQVCKECGRIYGSMEKLRRHTESHTKPESDLVRPKRKVYECKICKQNFATERHVTQHFSTKHQNCKTNNSAKKSGSVLQMVKVGECATVLWYCKDCDSYVVELKSHLQEKHLYCTVCGKTFASQALLRRHTVVHTKTDSKRKSLLCHHRGNRSANKQQFNCHIKRHLGEVMKNHKCDICLKCFWTQRMLTIHRRIHSNESPILCSFCGLVFTQEDNVEKHVCVSV